MQRLFLLALVVRSLTAYFIGTHLDDAGWFPYGIYNIFDAQARGILDGTASAFWIADRFCAARMADAPERAVAEICIDEEFVEGVGQRVGEPAFETNTDIAPAAELPYAPKVDQGPLGDRREVTGKGHGRLRS